MRSEGKLRVAVAMSGGVDSLRTAALLRDAGHDVLGIHMHLLPRYEGDDADESVRNRKESLDALASKLGIPLFFSDLRSTFEKHVIQPFLLAYQAGLTPNPCVICNPRLKFGYLLHEAKQLGAERLATGHYVNLLPPDGASDRFRLYRGRDPAKDQSYFLYGLSQEQLASALFPLGRLTKREVTDWAAESRYVSSVPEESQEICFIPSGHYSEFLRERLGLSPTAGQGPIIDMDGKTLGMHQGIFHYTIGQRRGLGIPSTEPYYVVGLNRATNTVYVGRARDLYCRELKVDQVNWVSVMPPTSPIYCQIRIRNQHKPASGCVTPLGETAAIICFDVPQRAVTPGQAAVFYEGDLLLGGGTIVETSPAEPGSRD